MTISSGLMVEKSNKLAFGNAQKERNHLQLKQIPPDFAENQTDVTDPEDRHKEEDEGEGTGGKETYVNLVNHFNAVNFLKKR